jgi:Tol biopolymer transport system component
MIGWAWESAGGDANKVHAVVAVDERRDGVGRRVDLFSSWAPDGQRFAFHSNRVGNVEVYTMAADGTNVVRVTNNAVFDVLASWRP